MKPHEFTMPEVGCTPRELHEAIAVCSMQLARVTTLVAEYKNKLAAAEAKYKKEFEEGETVVRVPQCHQCMLRDTCPDRYIPDKEVIE